MLLTYSYSKFKEKILSGEKKHTLRDDTGKRWRAGRSIQHWMGNPRNKRRNPLIHEFYSGECVSVQDITMIYSKDHDRITIIIHNWYNVDNMNRILPQHEVRNLIANDGLSREEFISHFFDSTGTWKGRIIHFTKIQY